MDKFDGGLQLLHEAEDDAVEWLEATATTTFAKWNESGQGQGHKSKKMSKLPNPAMQKFDHP